MSRVRWWRRQIGRVGRWRVEGVGSLEGRVLRPVFPRRHADHPRLAGRLRFGAADEPALSELPTILREFRPLYPRINLELTVTQSGTQQRRLNAGRRAVLRPSLNSVGRVCRNH
ncbi:MAG: LysR substrate-binding domain-containing protein [Microlunatus sp.]